MQKTMTPTDLMSVYSISSAGTYKLFGEGFDELSIKSITVDGSNVFPSKSMYLAAGTHRVIIKLKSSLTTLPQNTFLK